MTEGMSEDTFLLLQQLHALCDIYDTLSSTLQESAAPRLHGLFSHNVCIFVTHDTLTTA